MIICNIKTFITSSFNMLNFIVLVFAIVFLVIFAISVFSNSSISSMFWFGFFSLSCFYLYYRFKKEEEKLKTIEWIARVEEETLVREKENKAQEKGNKAREIEKRIANEKRRAEEERIEFLEKRRIEFFKLNNLLNALKYHLPFNLSANYADINMYFDEDLASPSIDFIENYKDQLIWNNLLEALKSNESIDINSTTYFAKIRSLLDDKNYFVVGETTNEIQEFFNMSTQVELLELISTCTMAYPISLFTVFHLSREFRKIKDYDKEKSEYELNHFIVKENSKVKIQKLFLNFEDYAYNSKRSFVDINSQSTHKLESIFTY